MNKTDVATGLGIGAVLVLCCGAHLLALVLAAPILALISGEIALLVVALIVSLGVAIWASRSNRCERMVPWLSAVHRAKRTGRETR